MTSARTQLDFSPTVSLAIIGAGPAGLSLALQAAQALPDARIYIGGAFDSYNNLPRPNLARVLPDGTLSPSPTTDGRNSS